MVNVVGSIPEFTGDDQVAGTGIEVVSHGDTQADTEEVSEEEKEAPTEPPAVEKPTEEANPQRDDTGLQKQVQGLESEKEKLLQEIKSLRGDKRVLKQEEIIVNQKKIDDLKDVNPADVDVIDRVVKSRGYVTAEEAHRMFYESVKQEELNKFLEKFPEYKPENDPNDLNWRALERELSNFKAPSDPHKTIEVLERAHRLIAKTSSDRGTDVKRVQAKIASTGGGGAQRSSSRKSFPPEQRALYERGGWSEEEIIDMEKNLPD